MRVTIYFGPPGTGKTTQLLDVVMRRLDAGVSPDRIGFMAFTRKAANEAIDRAIEKFGITRKEFPWFRTFHSAAFKLLELKKTDVMTTDNYRELGEMYGLVFKGTYNHHVERVPIDVRGSGDKCLAIYAMMRARQTSIEQEWRNANYDDLPLRVVERFALQIDEYKKAHHLYDFTDMIDECQHNLDSLDTLIIDEAQDLTMQQWMFAKRLGVNVQNIHIGGDDDQAIYGWSGATHRPLLTIAGARVVLPTTFRLPRLIHQIAGRVSSRIKIRADKQFAPRASEGTISWLREPESVDLSVGKWLLLCRNRHQLDRICDLSRGQGVVFHHDGEWSNSTPSIRAVVAYERIRQGEHISPPEFRLVSRFVLGARCDKVDKIQWGDVAWPWTSENRPNWLQTFSIGPAEREYIRSLRRRQEPLTRPGRVVISTVHGAKGGEADNVMLVTDISNRVYQSAHKNPDDENRVLYVGLTRAKENLFLVQPQTRNFWTI